MCWRFLHGVVYPCVLFLSRCVLPTDGREMTFRWTASEPFGADECDAHIFKSQTFSFCFWTNCCLWTSAHCSRVDWHTIGKNDVQWLRACVVPTRRKKWYDTIRKGLTVLFPEDRGNVLKQIPKWEEERTTTRWKSFHKNDTGKKTSSAIIVTLIDVHCLRRDRFLLSA